MEWEVPSCVATLHCTWRKDWKGRRRADDDRAAAVRLDQSATLATYRRKKVPRALARDEWIQRRLKMPSRIRSAAANRNAVKNRGKAEQGINSGGKGIAYVRSHQIGRSFMIMTDQLASDARTVILNSIRAHLAESALHDHAAEDRKYGRAAIGPEARPSSIALASSGHNVAFSAVDM